MTENNNNKDELPVTSETDIPSLTGVKTGTLYTVTLRDVYRFFIVCWAGICVSFHVVCVAVIVFGCCCMIQDIVSDIC